MSIFPKNYSKRNTYYVSASGTGTGISEKDPMSFQAAMEQEYGPGDCLLFCRGDVFYGNISPKVSALPDAPFVIGAYGVGPKPIISRAKHLSEGWVHHDGPFYKFDLTAVGTFEGVQDDGANVGFIEDSKGTKHGIRRANAESCRNQYDFYCSHGWIFIKSYIDPYKALGRLTLGNYHDWDSIIKISSNTEILDLQIENGGYGITLKKPGSENLYIHDCIIQNIGGTQLGTKGFTKAGNGIEFFGSAFNALVERNIFRNTYDVGFTIQGGHDCRWENITVRNNIFAYNTQACEIWTHGNDNQKQGVHGFSFTGNLCINQGEGWGTIARPDKYGGQGQVITTDILVYGYNAPALKAEFSDNTFFQRNSLNRIYSISSTGGRFLYEAVIYRNHIYMPSKTSICASTDDLENQYGRVYACFSEWQKQYQHDGDSFFHAIGNQDYSQMEQTAYNSVDFDEIVSVAKTAGLTIFH